ncbi:hypothetical protein BHU72_09230 [Desulfuribacillus stibiiarsenatis]|uniref:DUF1643 domain-containing protein n=1 Tax=Desulfuribacillus stibiiarsenatis TaxID=1390249 RepID=A0A1E5L3K2_9FIRM|nr:DUF1643 domain-containing protein [Desulfuribacillus stibiiarsenatis]OEH84664.1 hypothetical protein BHU72_09230 [Desulfuribacillus stibiiarsenatis]
MCEFMATVSSTAVFSSEERVHRYLLTRKWQEEASKATVIMLNPSYADEIKGDLSVMKVMNYLVDEGFGCINVVNLFAYVSPTPESLANNKDAVGNKNDDFIKKAIEDSDMIIIAWGSDKKKYIRRKRAVMSLLKGHEAKIKCFKDKDGKMGRHPSRLGFDLELIDFTSND